MQARSVSLSGVDLTEAAKRIVAVDMETGTAHSLPTKHTIESHSTSLSLQVAWTVKI